LRGDRQIIIYFRESCHFGGEGRGNFPFGFKRSPSDSEAPQLFFFKGGLHRTLILGSNSPPRGGTRNSGGNDERHAQNHACSSASLAEIVSIKIIINNNYIIRYLSDNSLLLGR